MKSILSALLIIAATAASQAGAPAPSGKNAKAPVAPAPGCIHSLTYSYIEPGYIHLKSQGGDLDGGYLDLSYDVGHNLFLEGSTSFLGGDFDQQEYSAGIGGYLPLTEKFHLVGRTGYGYTDTSLGDGVNEWYVSPGFRFQATCNLELYARAYMHVEEDETNWSGGVGVLYHLCPITALDVAGSIGEHDDWSIQVGIRIKL